ncbi:MAG: Ada metal-binding domain-containing protein, partial [Zoogloea sp.]|uniref:Ada metal-binding domain-containing protein n=1 Tax=Zoogloea sp. TaxID=49181 RepID=UPI003F2FDE5B
MPAKTAAVSSPERSGVLPDPRWARVLARDAAADGQFVYGVKTTGVYCRPSCPSRRPRPENVVFFADGDAARRAGFRPCLRCQPDQPSLAARHAEVVARVCRLLEEAEQLPSLAALAQAVQLSPHHLHR